VMYRVVNTIIQVPAGYIAYQRHLRQIKPSEIEELEQQVSSDGRD